MHIRVHQNIIGMSDLIKSQLDQIKDQLKTLTISDMTDDRAFSHLILAVVYKQKIEDHIVTDGKDDGGIDFVFYNDEDNKLILGQSKYTATLTVNEIIAEYNKMYATYCNFKKSNTGSYNADVKRELQNGIDQLPDDNSGSVEYCLFTTAGNIVNEEVLNRLEIKMTDFPIDSAKIFTQKDIENAIEAHQATIEIVTNDKIRIDKAGNYLHYDSDVLRGLMCNVMASSIVNLYNKYQNSGLFDLNIRRYIPNKLVDSEIKKTLDKNRRNFWFLNNGIIIACEKFQIDGNVIHLSNFSIVNGGQTTQLIGEYKGKNTDDFTLPCKIVAVVDEKQSSKYFSDIAQASNSQKPIFPRDLRSNSKEMVSLKRWLADEKVYLDIKRGSKKPKVGKFIHFIKNDELGQLLLSFVHQQPGTSRSGKRTIFENPDIYGKLYRENYQKTAEKRRFLLDLIALNDRYKALEAAYKNSDDEDHTLTMEQSEILKNGKQTIFALLGLCYMLANNDLVNDQVVSDQHYAEKSPFEYGPILSNYTKDDLNEKFEAIVYAIIDTVSELYNKAYENRTVSSVSNFMKTDARYYSDIVKPFISYFKYAQGKNIKENWDIFKR